MQDLTREADLDAELLRRGATVKTADVAACPGCLETDADTALFDGECNHHFFEESPCEPSLKNAATSRCRAEAATKAWPLSYSTFEIASSRTNRYCKWSVHPGVVLVFGGSSTTSCLTVAGGINESSEETDGEEAHTELLGNRTALQGTVLRATQGSV
jgi:hypothetical protein